MLEAQPYLESALTTAREHGRALLLIQAERLRAQLLAANGDWPLADTLFAEVMRQAEDLGLLLEAARTQAAWGEAVLRHSPTPEQGHPLLAEARAAFATHKARADLDALQDFLAV